MHGDPADPVAEQLDLAGVDTGPDPKSLRLERVHERERAADCPRGPVEGRKHAVTGPVDLAPSVPR